MVKATSKANSVIGNRVASPTKNLTVIGRFLFLTGIGFIGLLNVQPWIEVAKQIAPQIRSVPFLGSLVQIPFLGGWIEWIIAESISILGVVLWGITQYMEVIPDFVTEPEAKKWLIKIRYLVYIFEFAVCFMRFPAYQGGYAALAEDAPNWDVSLIDWWNLLVFLPLSAFAFEVGFHTLKHVLKGLRA